MGSSNGGNGAFSCQQMVVSSRMGEDGKMKTERYSSSTVGDMNNRSREVQQAYSNSDTGMNRLGFERQIDGRGRKMVKEHNARTGEEKNTDMYKGMSEDQYGEFEREWNEKA